MTREDVFQKVMDIIKPFVKNEDVFQQANESTNILQDLKVNSARLVDIILILKMNLILKSKMRMRIQ